jgi:hypothetical protein
MKHLKVSKTRKTLRDIIAGAMVIVLLYSISAVDSGSWIPAVTGVISFAYCMREAKARGMCYDLSR